MKQYYFFKLQKTGFSQSLSRDINSQIPDITNSSIMSINDSNNITSTDDFLNTLTIYQAKRKETYDNILQLMDVIQKKIKKDIEDDNELIDLIKKTVK